MVTGAGGLIGSESSKHLLEEGFEVVGIDNDMRAYFFGENASTTRTVEELKSYSQRFTARGIDIRDEESIDKVFSEFGTSIALVIHTAAQPSHDWAANEPRVDFGVNAVGTLNLLESCRLHSPEAVFIFTSTNKVYGDRPNSLPLVELESRWELSESHQFYEHGIDETMSIDQSKHSLFGSSKVAADIMVQEYGRYFGMKTGVFRGGCLTGPAHAGAELHGFLSYLMRCTYEGRPYQVFGYKGKQVRDNIHSYDLVQAFQQFYEKPRTGEVYNIGGGRHSNCSMREAIEICEELCGKRLSHELSEDNRIGDHIWWISDVRKFQQHYHDWNYRYGVRQILEEIYLSLGG